MGLALKGSTVMISYIFVLSIRPLLLYALRSCAKMLKLIVLKDNSRLS